jgi:hypothetical protein
VPLTVTIANDDPSDANGVRVTAPITPTISVSPNTCPASIFHVNDPAGAFAESFTVPQGATNYVGNGDISQLTLSMDNPNSDISACLGASVTVSLHASASPM